MRARFERPALALLAAFLLFPFLWKPVHLDDPLYVWSAQHIAERPLAFDFYGFDVNWYGWVQPIHVFQNPPLTSYVLALAGSVLGWTEPALHAVMLILALAAVVGAYELARALRAPPLMSALLLLASPGFLVSATTLMCDVTLLAFWLWALVAWRQGLAQPAGSRAAFGWLAAAGLCAAAASLAKYFGVALLPLFVLDAVVQRRRDPACLLAIAIPLLVLAGLEAWTHHLYGHGLLGQAVGFAQDAQGASGGGLVRALVTLAFVGGAVLPLALHAPAAGTIRFLLLAAVAAAAVVLAPGLVDPRSLRWLYPAGGGIRWGFALQLAVAAAAGASLVPLLVRHLGRASAPDGVLLAAWIAGTLVFAGALNWTTSVRSVLPLAPAAAMLLASALEHARASRAWRLGPLAASAAVALAVGVADQSAAQAGRRAAESIAQRYGAETHRLYFQGHWGFQYYMQELGFRALDVRERPLRPGDLVVVPLDNTNLQPLPPGGAQDETMLRFEVLPWLATQSERVGSGFYSSIWGPIPYAFARVEPQEVLVQRVTRPLRSASERPVPDSR